MTENEVLECFRSLAKSQGFYGRILRDLYEMQEKYPQNYVDVMYELMQFNDIVDLVLYIEQ